MRILLIDDDKDDQTLFCEAVKIISPDIHCDIAGNGQEGLKVLNNNAQLPQLIFLDINMPIMDGNETLNVIKATPKLKSLPVFIYSTSNRFDEIEKFVALGVGFITKPNKFEDLVRVLLKPIKETGLLSSVALTDALPYQNTNTN
jgi:CheY-like chemotaxis protein